MQKLLLSVLLCLMIIKHKLESLGFYVRHTSNDIEDTLHVWMHGEYVATFDRFLEEDKWCFFMAQKTNEWIINYCSERAKEIKKKKKKNDLPAAIIIDIIAA